MGKSLLSWGFKSWMWVGSGKTKILLIIICILQVIMIEKATGKLKAGCRKKSWSSITRTAELFPLAKDIL